MKGSCGFEGTLLNHWKQADCQGEVSLQSPLRQESCLPTAGQHGAVTQGRGGTGCTATRSHALHCKTLCSTSPHGSQPVSDAGLWHDAQHRIPAASHELACPVVQLSNC